jgi:hypothetical protein
MFEIFPHLFEFGGSCVGIVSEVGEFRRVWFGRVCCSWGVAFSDETDVFGLTPCGHHPQTLRIPLRMWNEFGDELRIRRLRFES